MAEQLCPECGCEIGDEAYEKEGISFCCEPCGTGCECECGCENVDECCDEEEDL